MMCLGINPLKILFTEGTEGRDTGRKNGRGGRSLSPPFSPVRMGLKSNHRSLIRARGSVRSGEGKSREVERQMDKERQQM